MFEYTYQNYFQFGYSNGRRFCNRQDPSETFIATYSHCHKQVDSWREANRLACIDIAEKAKGPIWVLLSGGTDSEICVRSFYEARVPIQIATLRFKNKENAHDLQYVEKLRSQLDCEIHYFDMDIELFWRSSEFYKIVDAIQCVSPILACHLWLADQLEGTPVMAQGEPHLKKDIPEDYVPGESPYLPSAWRLVESERLCSLYKHFIFQDRPAVPGFFQYLPEQFYTYLKLNPILQKLIQNEIPGKLGTRTSKNQIALQFYPEVEVREKYTGFEKIQKLHDVKRSELAQRFPFSDQNFSIEYGQILKDLELREP